MNSRVSKKLYSHVGKSIKKFRKVKKVSQGKLAEQVGLTRASITNIERGRQNVTLDTLWHIATILDVGIIELLPKPQEIQLALNAQLPSDVSRAEKKWIEGIANNER